MGSFGMLSQLFDESCLVGAEVALEALLTLMGLLVDFKCVPLN